MLDAQLAHQAMARIVGHCDQGGSRLLQRAAQQAEILARQRGRVDDDAARAARGGEHVEQVLDLVHGRAGAG